MFLRSILLSVIGFFYCFSAVADSPVLVLKVSNYGMYLLAESSSGGLLMAERLTTLHPSLWGDPPNFLFNDSPPKFMLTMARQLKHTEAVSRLRKEGAVRLYISAAGYAGAVNPEDIRSYRHKDTKAKKRLKQVLGKSLFRKIEVGGGYDIDLKGNFQAHVFAEILAHEWGISIEQVVAEEDSYLAAEVAGRLIAHSGQSPSDSAQVLQATTLAQPLHLSGNKICPPLPSDVLPKKSADSLAYAGGSFEAGLRLKDAVTHGERKKYRSLLRCIEARLQRISRQSQEAYPLDFEEALTPDRCKKNNFGAMVLALSLMSHDESVKEAQALGMHAKVVVQAAEEARQLARPVREHALASLICFNRLLDRDVQTLVVVDEFADWMSLLDGKGLKEAFKDSCNRSDFREYTYQQYVETMELAGKPVMSKAAFEQSLKAFPYQDVLYLTTVNRSGLLIEAARKRLAFSLPDYHEVVETRL